MLSAYCSTVSPTTSSTCFACSYLRRCAQHRSKRCAFSCSRSGHASAKQLVVSVFTWPAAGLFRISSKPSATTLRLSRPVRNHILGRAKRSCLEKRFVQSKQRQRKPIGRSTTERDPLLCHQCAFRATILASDELTRLGVRWRSLRRVWTGGKC
jgi:hypothetical protein